MELEKFGVVEMTAQEQNDENGGFIFLINAAISLGVTTAVVVSLVTTFTDGYQDGYKDYNSNK